MYEILLECGRICGHLAGDGAALFWRPGNKTKLKFGNNTVSLNFANWYLNPSERQIQYMDVCCYYVSSQDWVNIPVTHHITKRICEIGFIWEFLDFTEKSELLVIKHTVLNTDTIV